MEEVKVNAEFLFELSSKQDWINRVPRILPEKIRAGEKWLWIDKNGNSLEGGVDFYAAEEQNSFPCKVYRVQNVASLKHNCLDENIKGTEHRCKEHCGKCIK